MSKPQPTLALKLRRQPIPYPLLTPALRKFILDLDPSINNPFTNPEPFKAKLNRLRNSCIFGEQ